MNESHKIEAFISRVHELSQEGSIPWQPALNENQFEAYYPPFSIKSYEATYQVHDGSFVDLLDAKKLTGYFMDILDKEGLLIERIHPKNCSTNSQVKLREIYKMARNQVKGIGEAIDTILELMEGSREDASKQNA